ncbi:methyl-accepting chemotaxis protein [Flexibacterium corallicola]|uniref:methyl-accepting chemotaxis protein n=1 Tax=Flexibacterium corallicola TaxID=3037259 RepID=UPI00286ED9F5|nr:HAMP domain-containing methyl-accepting chemotaxis protein [Pseudovibrio sp. M1P-2-3]
MKRLLINSFYSVITRIIALGLLPVAVIIASLTFGWTIQNATLEAFTTVRSNNILARDALSVGSELESLRAMTAEFMLAPAANIRGKVNRSVKTIDSKLEASHNGHAGAEDSHQGEENDVNVLIDTIRENISQFSQEFKALNKAQNARGTSSGSGLLRATAWQGAQLRSLAGNIRKDNPLGANIGKITVFLSDMQKNEWVLETKGVSTSAEKEFRKGIASVDKVLEWTKADTPIAERFIPKWDEYKTSIARLDELSAEIEKSAKNANAIIRTTRPLVQNLVDAGTSGASEATETFENQRAQRLIQAAIVFGLATLFAVVTTGLICWSLSRPLSRLHSAMSELARGNTNIKIIGTKGRSEFNKMAQTLEVFRSNALERDKLNAERENETQAQLEREKRIRSLVSKFEVTAGDSLNTFNGSIGELRSASHTLRGTIDQVSTTAGTAGAAVSEASQNVSTVASASEEISMSISEVANEAANSNKVASSVREQAEETAETINELASTAGKIGEVVGLIKDIADQTNLLALNATIEAARAGEMGKGFAVVASEVKTLANQTTSATEDISKQVGAIQGASEKAVSSIVEVNKLMDGMSGSSSAVAAAVDQQSATIAEIARSVNEVSNQSQLGENEMGRVATTIASSTEVVVSVDDQAEVIAHNAQKLDEEIRQFLKEVQSA